MIGGTMCSSSAIGSDTVLTQQSQPSTQASNQKPGLLLVVDSVEPQMQISWIARGTRETFTQTVPYTAPVGGDLLGHNVKGYVALGGTRIETGAGHPKGAVIRLGITKIENARAFFAKIDPGSDIEMVVSNVKFNQPVKYNPGTGMMHLKYAIGDLEACALPGTARNQYLLSDPQDTLGGRVIAGENATPGALDGGKDHGSITIEVNQDDPTLVTMRVRVPYGLLRHLQDPWVSALPGTFFEPIHLHAEAELIPVDVAPLVREPILPETNPNQDALKNIQTKQESESP